MKIMTGVILPTVAALVFSGMAQAEDSVKPVTGKAQVTLEHVHAVQENGSPAPQHDAACIKQLSAPESRYVGMKVSSEYTIDTASLMMSAKSMLPSPNTLQPLELTIDLSPLGMAGVYAFGAFKPSSLPQDYVYFTIDKGYKNPVSTFMIINKDEKYNCVISSSGQAMSEEQRSHLVVKQ
ncbi:hypothetical protein D4100_16435 [Serratia inhibens]|uniref:BsmB n=1 Tax=Serratia inhibens TaxID=2338073 RepID=A0AA92X250_9GAMM|nr:hypothetical protein [Serratia inhibens]RJF54665.1 hypothetical protein D4100_16435 [Serratia inhibens]